MRIVHVGHVPVPAWRPESSGLSQHPGRWVLNHALAQKAAGIDVEIVTQVRGPGKNFSCNVEGVRVHFVRTAHPYRHLTFYAIDSARLAGILRDLAPDVVHAHGTEAAFGHAAVRSGLPFCITAQGLFFQIVPALGRKATWNERFLRWGENMVWNRTEFAVAKSEYVKAALAERYRRLDIALIPNTYEPALDAPLAHRSGFSIAYIGSMDERKGVQYLAKAMPKIAANVPDVELHVMGNAPEGSAKGCEAETVASFRSTLGGRLHLHGRIPSREVFEVLDRSRALVAPSLEEMFGNQLIEGLMRGCHGIVTEGTALAENARRFGNATIVPQKNPEAIADAAIKVLSADFDAVEAEDARNRIKNYMSPAAVAEKHRKFYERVLESGSDGSGRTICRQGNNS